MEYGWVSGEIGLSQQDGFFVDENNRIVWWPEKDGPGYYLEYGDAQAIAARHADAASGLVFVGLAMIFVIGLSIGVGAPFIHPLFDTIFSLTGLRYSLFWPGSLGAIIAVMFLARRRRKKLNVQFAEYLQAAEKVDLPRPKSGYLGQRSMTGLFGFAVVPICGAVFVWFASSLSPLTGDQISATLFGWALIFLSLTMFYLVAKAAKGVDPAQVRFYDLEADVPKGWKKDKWVEYLKESDQTRIYEILKEQREICQKEFDAERDRIRTQEAEQKRWSKRFGRFFDRWTSGWRMFLVTLIFGFAVLAGFIQYKEFVRVYPTVDAILTRYEESVYGHDIELPEGPYAVKWTRRPTVMFGDLGTDRIRRSADFVYGRLNRLTELVSDPRQPATISFKPNVPDKGTAAPSSRAEYYRFQHTRGNLLNFQFFFDHAVAEESLSFATTRTKNDYYDEVGRSMAYASYGLWLDFSRNDDDWKDRSEETVYNDEVVIAMHYDPRIRPGASREETMAIAEVIAQEIVAAQSFEGWRNGRTHLTPYRLLLKGHFDEAMTGLVSLAAKGDRIAQYYLGGLHLKGLVGPVNKEAAVKWLGVSAQMGFAPARTLLENMAMQTIKRSGEAEK